MSKILIVLIGLTTLACRRTEKQHQKSETYFNFEFSIQIPGQPEQIYDGLTGDISPWWDHTFSSKPYQ